MKWNLFHFSLEKMRTHSKPTAGIATATVMKKNERSEKKKQINSQIYELNCHLFIFRHTKKSHTDTDTHQYKLQHKVLKRLVQVKCINKPSQSNARKSASVHAKEKRNTCGRFTNCTYRVLYALHWQCSEIARIQKMRMKKKKLTITTTLAKNSLKKWKEPEIYIIAVIISYFNVRSMLCFLSLFCLFDHTPFASDSASKSKVHIMYVLWIQCVCLTWKCH